jgi:hypothetical protein
MADDHAAHVIGAYSDLEAEPRRSRVHNEELA